MRRRFVHDLFHLFMTVSWPIIFASFAAFFFMFNLLFAAACSLQPDDIANLNPAGYRGRFFFSVETFETVGYGDMHPQTPFAHIVAAIEIFIGLMSLALITGMMFARFSKPTARFVFARNAVVRPLNCKLTLMLRAANARQITMLLDRGDDAFDGRRRNVEQAASWSGHQHGFRSARQIGDQGALEAAIEPGVELQSLGNGPTATRSPGRARHSNSPEADQRTASGAPHDDHTGAGFERGRGGRRCGAGNRCIRLVLGSNAQHRRVSRQIAGND